MLAIRHIKHGTYLSFEDTQKEAKEFGIPIAKTRDFGKDIRKALETIEPMTGIEGYVLRYDSIRSH